MMQRISDKTIGRLSLYRRLLVRLREEGQEEVRSRQLAALASGTPAQVRRDLMVASGCQGRPSHGYDVKQLLKCIGQVLDNPEGENVALVGIGNLGRALLAYLSERRPRLTMKAAFDCDSAKVGCTVHGCRCYHESVMKRILKAHDIRVAIVAVPARVAQDVAEQLVAAGVRGLLNFAPVRLKVPPEVFVENIDISMSLEKTAFFAREACTENCGEMR